MSLQYFPWHVLVGVCSIAFLFLWLFLAADSNHEESRLDNAALRRIADDVLAALDECEDELAAERARSSELRAELARRDQQIAELLGVRSSSGAANG